MSRFYRELAPFGHVLICRKWPQEEARDAGGFAVKCIDCQSWMNTPNNHSTGEGDNASITHHTDNSYLFEPEAADDHLAMIYKMQKPEKIVKNKKERLKCPYSVALSQPVKTILRAKSGAFTTVFIDVEGVCNAVLKRYLPEYLAGMANRLNR